MNYPHPPTSEGIHFICYKININDCQLVFLWGNSLTIPWGCLRMQLRSPFFALREWWHTETHLTLVSESLCVAVVVYVHWKKYSCVF